MPFTEAQLGISQDEINKIKAALVNDGLADALAQAMAEAEQLVDDACASWEVPIETRRRHWRVLVLFDVWTRLKTVPEALAADYQKTQTALENIRAGKHSYAEKTPSRPRFTGGWGGAQKVAIGTEETQETTDHFEGEGSPEGVQDGGLNDTYTDTVALRNYLKTTSTSNTGWVLAGTHFEGEGSPEGAIEALKWDTYEDLLTNEPWVKTTDVGNTGWLKASA
jgi:hypothetical protein